MKHRPVSTGRKIAGVIVAAFGTGPTLMLLAWLTNSWLSQDAPQIPGSELFVAFPEKLLSSSILGLVLSIPSAILNAFVVNMASRLSSLAAVLVAVISGGAIGLAAGSFLWLSMWSDISSIRSETKLDAFVLCPATGALMGLLYWLIAIAVRGATERA